MDQYITMQVLIVLLSAKALQFRSKSKWYCSKEVDRCLLETLRIYFLLQQTTLKSYDGHLFEVNRDLEDFVWFRETLQASTTYLQGQV